jgi:opacity protein-like surface antigen
MFKLSTIALAACALAVTAMSAAKAADLTPTPYVPPPPAVGGWYLRGDIGYKIWANPSVDWDDSLAGVDFDDENLDDTGMIGVGVGYRFNQWFRADVTLDWEWPANFSATTPCPPCGGGGVTTNDESADISALTALANVYVDLGNYHGFSPYVGAGIGASWINIDNIESHNGDGTTADWGDADDWSFAWALMAGVSYDFTPNVALDLNYRYLNLGSAESDTIDAGAGDGKFHYDNLQAHEIRLGLRYTIF